MQKETDSIQKIDPKDQVFQLRCGKCTILIGFATKSGEKEVKKLNKKNSFLCFDCRNKGFPI